MLLLNPAVEKGPTARDIAAHGREVRKPSAFSSQLSAVSDQQERCPTSGRCCPEVGVLFRCSRTHPRPYIGL
jgi:hypothetical protein